MRLTLFRRKPAGCLAACAIHCTPSSRAAAPAQQKAPVCANCHEAQWRSIDLTPHGAKNDADGSMCQACHGNAAEHMKDPTKVKPDNPFGKGHTADERTAVCLPATRATATSRSGPRASTSSTK